MCTNVHERYVLKRKLYRHVRPRLYDFFSQMSQTNELISRKMSLPTLSDYCLLEKIGTGSYATVYKASKKVRALDLRFGSKTV